MAKPSRREFLNYSAMAAAGAAFAPSTFAGAKPFRPRLAMCNESFEGWKQKAIFEFIAKCGYQGVEIAPFTLNTDVRKIKPKWRAFLREAADEAGIEIVGLHWILSKTEGFHLTTPDKEIRKATTAYLGDLARLCSDLGGKIMIFGSPQQRNLLPGVSREQGMKNATEVLKAAMPVLEELGVTVAMEPLGSNATNFLTTAAEAVELAERVDSPYCKMMLDCKAMVSEPTPIPDLIRKWADWSVHFHANDPNLQGPGMGKLDFLPIFEALRDVDFGGWVSVEVFDYTPGPKALATESIAYMRECLAELNG